MAIEFQTVGLVGAFIIGSSLVPQMHKVYSTKSAKDISLRFQVLYVTGLLLFLVYGYGENLWPVYIPTTLEAAAAIIMLCMKLYYDRRENKLAAKESHDLEGCAASRLSPRGESKFTAIAQTPQ